MSSASKAVFLSYASQDAEAARRIAEALRASGVEVWFDQSELVGGDAWDAKIRKQIKDCALFVPVISASTNARAEGYFRLEWKLAVDRSHLMADDQPFFFPVVIGDLSDAAARVPDKFREVQWTRVRLDESPAELAARVARFLSGEVLEAGRPRPAERGEGAAPPSKRKTGLAKWWWLIFPIMGMALPIIAVLKRPERPRPEPPTLAAPAKEAPKPMEPARAAVPATDPQRVALARFENLTGDATLDPVARLLEAELTRGLGMLPGVRLVPVEAVGRTAARGAARAAGAASVIVGSYLKRGDQVELSAEIGLVDQGEIFGSLGSKPMSAANVRGPELEEFVDRLASGAEIASGLLQKPPTRLAAEIYHRPWPRRSVEMRAASIRVTQPNAAGYAEVVAIYQALLAEAPELLRLKQAMARLLLNSGRFEESQRAFQELLGTDRDKLSESELADITYDDAFMRADPERALAAANKSLEIRPAGDATRKIVSSLWALSRPRSAFNEIERWWNRHAKELTDKERQWVQLGLLTTETTMLKWEGDPAKAVEALERMRRVSEGQPILYYHQQKFAALAALGREDEQIALVNEAASQPAASRAEPFFLQWQGHALALHLGRPDEARRWLEAAVKSWDDLPPAVRDQDKFQLTAALLLAAAGRHQDALKAADRMLERSPDLPNVVGARAVVLNAVGRADEASLLVKRLEEWDTRFARGQPQYWRARLAARAGDKVRAVELLRQAVASGLWFGNYNAAVTDLGRNEPEFAVLRGSEPYEQLLKPRG